MEKRWKIVLIRHGKTPGNEEKRYIGRTDEGLSGQGLLELRERKYPKAGRVFSSPMKRCLETCACLYAGAGIQKIESFREIDFGTFEGKNYRELAKDPDYQAWIDSGGMLVFPGGESREEFIQRSLQGFREVIAVLCGGAEAEKTSDEASDAASGAYDENTFDAALVVHGGTILAILSSLYGGDYYDYQIPNAGAYLAELIQKDGEVRITAVRKYDF